MPLKDMQKIVEVDNKRRENNKRYSLATFQARTTKRLKSLDYIRNCRKHVANNGNRIHHLQRIDEYVYNKVPCHNLENKISNTKSRI